MPNVQEKLTFIPLRFLSEGIGANVTWVGVAQTVVVKAGDTTAPFWIGTDTIDVIGQSMPVGTPVFINSDGWTVIPLRIIANLLGWDVQWNELDWVYPPYEIRFLI